MDRASLDSLARFFGRERLGHLYLKAWRFLVDGMSRRLALPDYIGERILDRALLELDSRLDEFRLSIDARPTVWLFALGWAHAEELLKGRAGDRIADMGDAEFWRDVQAEQEGADGALISRGIVAALGELDDERHQILLCLDAVARGPANRQIVSESTGEALLVVDELRRDAREALRARFAIHSPQIETAAKGRDPVDPDTDPLSEALCTAFVNEDVFPPLDDIESLYGWLDRHFERSRAEIALSALWKRLPPPEHVEVQEKIAPGPMVALAESLYERMQKMEDTLASRLDAIEGHEQGGGRPATSASEPPRESGTDSTRAGSRYPTRSPERGLVWGDDAGRARETDPGRTSEPRFASGTPSGPQTGDTSAAPTAVTRGVRHDRVATPPADSSAERTVTRGDDVISNPVSRPAAETAHAPAFPSHAGGWRTNRPATPSQPEMGLPGTGRDSEPRTAGTGTTETDESGIRLRDLHGHSTGEIASPGHADEHAAARTDAPLRGTDATPQGDDNQGPAASTTGPGSTAEPSVDDAAANHPKPSRFTGFWRAIRPAPKEKTHEEVVQRLEKYLPAGKKVRLAPPGSALHEDPNRESYPDASGAAADDDAHPES